MATSIAIAIAHHSPTVLASKIQTKTSDRFTSITLNGKIIQSANLIAKKSGGRSGGGSFKSRPSRSQKSSPSRNSNQRKSSSPSRSYDQRDSTYRERDRTYPRHSSPTYYHRGTTHSRGSSGFGNFIISIFILVFLGGLIFVLFHVFRQMFGSNSDSSSKAERKIAQERDNDRVTVSLLQIVLSSEAQKIQQDLLTLSTRVDTSSDEGLMELMRESALILLRNDLNWTHVLANSHSLDISQAEQEFDRLSLIQRSKFSGESFSNIDGVIETRQARNHDESGFPAYVVVTLLFGTADDNALFAKIHNSETLKEVLLQLSSMREDYLMKFELLWTPQTVDRYLTDEELLIEYTDAMPL
ncbi:DUF1517 domain-containing protein [Waterburya agarophytonicola K14]|uniref:DUF1517 domain-containing protein n=1 Tax=Waterburya agarophytonicola KI4 TaxID=2874699 RepID=A0A964FH95_9CYAN|nr:DUF1517 domain-containing protein [Waterburya agarophytonicola]MCC0177419.1 DUF1517 domain-containing protein [Waterburya agarophytonicola KI4]